MFAQKAEVQLPSFCYMCFFPWRAEYGVQLTVRVGLQPFNVTGIPMNEARTCKSHSGPGGKDACPDPF